MEQQEIVDMATQQFIDAIKKAKLVPPKTVEIDGKIHHFSSTGRAGDNKGWYVMHGGRFPSGAFGDFRQGIEVRGWKANLGRPLTATERKEIAEDQRTRQTNRKAQSSQEQDRARKLATRILRAAAPAQSDHDYLARKGIKPNGASQLDNLVVTIEYSKKTNRPFLQLATKDGKLRFGLGVEDDLAKKPAEEICKAWTSCLVNPMFDENGFQSVQLISKAGDKKFLFGAKKQGCYSILGDIKHADTVLMAEGFATAATIHEITDYPVVIAYDAGNLPSVARSIRQQYPEVSIVLCGDDDFMTTNAAGIKINPGATKAKQAAAEVGGDVLLPVFTVEDRPPKATDFNDMAALEGRESVVCFFGNYFSKRSINMTHTISEEEEEAIIARPANSNVAPASGREEFDNKVTVGTIVDSGRAPFMNDPKNKPTYFVSVNNGDNTKTLWGVDLGKALDESGLGIGDKAVIRNKGKVRAETYVDIYDQSGTLLRKEPRTITKNAWEIGSLDNFINDRIVEERPVEERVEQRSAPQHRVYEAVPEPVAAIKTHFAPDEFTAIQKIWKNVPHKTAYHTESGYHLVVDDARKVVVARDRIELAKKPRHRLDQYYVAACEQARQFWDGQMEVHGDNQHRIKSWAYATVYGVEVTNFAPNDRERLEAEKIMVALRKKMQPSFGRPSAPRGPSAKQAALKA